MEERRQYHSAEYDVQSQLRDTTNRKSETFFLSYRYRLSADEEFKSDCIQATEAGIASLKRKAQSGRYETLYVSQALFRNGRGIASNLAAFTHIWCDLDCYDSEPQDVMQSVIEKCFAEAIPLPSTFTSSGRGVYLKWNFLDPIFVKKGRASQKLIVAMNQRLVEIFKDFQADAKAFDATRVLRVPGSVNHKSGNVCHVMHDTDMRYSVSELKAAFLPFSEAEVSAYKKEKRQKAIERKARIVSLQAERLARRPLTGGRANFSAKVHAHKIINDLRKLAEIRFDGVVKEGFRDIFGHIGISALSTCTDADMLLSEARTFMSDFLSNDYLSREFEHHSKSAISLKKKDKSYRYSTKKMIELLSITSQEMQHLEVLVSSDRKAELKRKKDIDTKAQKRRSAGSKTREEYIASVKSGEPKTWEILGISKTSYYRKKDAYDAELAARREAEAAKKQQISDARFIASETAFRGMRDASEIGYRNNTRKILAEELEAMSVEAFYELHSKKKIASMRKRKAAHKAAKKDDGTVVVDFSDVVMRHTLARIAAG